MSAGVSSRRSSTRSSAGATWAGAGTDAGAPRPATWNKVIALAGGQPQRPGERGEHLLARLGAAPLFQPRVVVGRTRLQLAGTSVQVVELEPPSVRTGLLPGQETSDFAMPLDEFVAEVIALLEAEPDAPPPRRPLPEPGSALRCRPGAARARLPRARCGPS